MSMKKLEGNMAIATNPTLEMMFKKINDLVEDANEALQADLRMRNKIVTLEKELKSIRVLLMNRG